MPSDKVHKEEFQTIHSYACVLPELTGQRYAENSVATNTMAVYTNTIPKWGGSDGKS